MQYSRKHLAHHAALALAGLIAAAVFAGCPQDEGTDSTTAPGAVAPTGSSQPETETTGQSTASVPPVAPATSAWHMDGFRLGMAVADARALISTDIERTVREQWRVEGVTGMLIVGSYSERPHMVGSLMFLDGSLVAVIKNQRETYAIFQEKFAELKSRLGEPVGETPEFAQGRAFIAEILAAEEQPDEQYLWGNAADQWLYIAGHYYEDELTTYMLIDAVRYDNMAAEMAVGGS